MPLINAGQRVTASELALNYSASDIGAVTVTAAALTDLTGTFTVPANDSAVGNIYEIEAWGNGTQGSTAETLRLVVVFGGNAMAGDITLGVNYMAINTNFRWRAVGRVICLSTGTTGAFQSLLHGELSSNGTSLLTSGGSSANATNAFVACESSGSTTINTTIAQGLKIQATWGATTGAPSITKRVAIQRKLGLG